MAFGNILKISNGENSSVLAISALIGTIVGAGIFGLPYVISKSGLIPAIFYFLILGGAMILVHLFFGEIVLRTKEQCRLPGFSQKYLGKTAKILVSFSTIFGLVGALLAYLIIGGDFLKIILSFFFPFLNSFSSFIFSLFFWLVLVYFIFRGLKIIAPTEVFTNFLFFSIIFLIIVFAFPKINLQNFSLFNSENIFLPYGIVLFSLAGLNAVPEAIDILKKRKEERKIKKIIILTFLIVISLYLVFSLTVIGLSGSQTSAEVFQGLIPFLGYKVIVLGSLAALITIADSFLIIGLHLKNTLVYDYHFKEIISAFLTCCLPLILFLLGLRSFIATIGFVGTVIGAIEGVVIIFLFQRAKKLGNRQPEYSLKIPKILLYSLISVFILGAVSQFI